jgi:hypothetical protein
VAAFLEQYPSDLGTSTKPDAAGFVYNDPAKYHDVFAADIPLPRTNAMAVAQKPVFGEIFGQAGTAAAWADVPSWYMVTREDRALNPELQRFYAGRMQARTVQIQSSHVPFLSHPRDVADLIGEAASGASARRPLRTFDGDLCWMDADATTGREPDGSCTMTASLGSEAAIGAGTGSAFFGRGSIAAARRGIDRGTSST